MEKWKDPIEEQFIYAVHLNLKFHYKTLYTREGSSSEKSGLGFNAFLFRTLRIGTDLTSGPAYQIPEALS